MKPFALVMPTTVEGAVEAVGEPGSKLKAGGVDLLSEWKGMLVQPDRVVNLLAVKELAFVRVASGGLHLGATTVLADVAAHARVQQEWPALAQAAGELATPQIRNMGTVGGNLLQRPRCWYYRNWATVCLRKKGGPCFAGQPEGENQYHAIFDNSICAMVHASSLAPALIALGARVKTAGPKGGRTLPIEQLFVAPEKDPTCEHCLEAQEVLTEVIVPAGPRSAYVEIKERQSQDWPLANAAAALRMQGERVASCRLCLGAVAPIPWRVPDAEKVLAGHAVTEELAARAGEAAVRSATPLAQNHYKVQIAGVALKRAILKAAGKLPA